MRRNLGCYNSPPPPLAAKSLILWKEKIGKGMYGSNGNVCGVVFVCVRVCLCLLLFYFVFFFVFLFWDYFWNKKKVKNKWCVWVHCDQTQQKATHTTKLSLKSIKKRKKGNQNVNSKSQTHTHTHTHMYFFKNTHLAQKVDPTNDVEMRVRILQWVNTAESKDASMDAFV